MKDLVGKLVKYIDEDFICECIVVGCDYEKGITLVLNEEFNKEKNIKGLKHLSIGTLVCCLINDKTKENYVEYDKLFNIWIKRINEGIFNINDGEIGVISKFNSLDNFCAFSD